ncbi:MAG TPA: hypothetical protein VH186_00320 [Chloroflexia bacterium]|nr:hypothetical protein [Chloroflexia bacterium]
MEEPKTLVLNGETRLSNVLNAIPGALEYIVALNPHDFKRLRNPVARKYMSPRISLRRIAAMVQMPESKLLHDLAALGDGKVEVAEAELPASAPRRSPQEPPEWFKQTDPENIHWVDLMPIDQVLGDPFPVVSVAVKQLAPGKVLGIRHHWEPQPLYDIWEKMRLQWFSRQVGEDEWEIFVYKPTSVLPSFAPDILVELRHLPESEAVPRVLTMFEQLLPGQLLEVSGFTPQTEELLQRAFAKKYPQGFSWQPATTSAGKPVIHLKPVDKPEDK